MIIELVYNWYTRSIGGEVLELPRGIQTHYGGTKYLLTEVEP